MRKQSTENRVQKKKRGLIFVVSGPSGSGKSTLLKKLIAAKTLKNKLKRSISFTTRPRRSGEKNGRDYFFLSQAEFREKKQAEKILEWTRYLGYDYATPKDFLEEQLQKGRNLVLCLDLQGSLKIKRLYPRNTVTIFIISPSLGALKERISKRCNQTKKEEIQRRLELAEKELLAAHKYDYCLVNDKLNRAVNQLQEIILTKINQKRGRGKWDTCR